MIRFSLLGSGSSGNAILIASPTGKILVDNGLSLRKLQERAAGLHMDVSDLKAVFVTHEHMDHVNGIGVLARRFDAPVFMTAGTYENLPEGVGKIPRLELFDPGDTINVDGLEVTSFSVSHDAADPVNYVVRSGGVQLGLAGDLGHASHLVKNRLAGSHGLVLESNYCPDMLKKGSYPYAVQQRIRGNRGHLSNADMCGLLAGLVHDALRLVVLVHISEENNTRRLAHDMAARVIENHPARVFVARQDRATRLFEIAG
ncbi:MAG: MBL fold metallo-hydrolase [Candidatus Hydrogenedentes bacterium]|nr:MBL fold metallo-hydrolase [Candidatus Hydrogenedentota bacterium]